LEKLKDVLTIEITARNNYQKDEAIYSNEKVIRTLHRIKLDEDKHIAMLQVLVSTLEKK
jgi:rubrerythrin